MKRYTRKDYPLVDIRRHLETGSVATGITVKTLSATDMAASRPRPPGTPPVDRKLPVRLGARG